MFSYGIIPSCHWLLGIATGFLLYIFEKHCISEGGTAHPYWHNTEKRFFAMWSSSVFYFSANNLQPWQKQAEVSDDEAHTVTGLW